MREFTGRTALVTGAAGGIGRALALAAAARGMRVLVCDVDSESTVAVAAECVAEGAPAALARAFDVRDASTFETRVAEVTAEWGGVDLLFCNAGVLVPRRLWEQTAREFDWLLDVNVKGVVNGIRACVPGMLARGRDAGRESHVVITGSMGGLIASPMLGAIGQARRTVDVAKMRGIDAVFGHVLQRPVNEPLELFIVAPLGRGGLRQRFHLECGLDVLRVVPRPNETITLDEAPRLHAAALGLRRNVFGIRNFGDLALAVVLPGMERTLEIVALHAPRMAHVRAEVTTIGVDHARRAVLAPPQCEFAIEVAQGLDLAGLELVGITDDEPAERHGQVDTPIGRRHGSIERCRAPSQQLLFREAREVLTGSGIR
ncbi:MAG: SDR family NAD(P)-dependent oxidoreductase [Gammaproteobacteria bacterium]|nr:SDR family NAD(P)-dependent oxidoreductase [Gammaproteobacteria bacterium]